MTYKVTQGQYMTEDFLSAFHHTRPIFIIYEIQRGISSKLWHFSIPQHSCCKPPSSLACSNQEQCEITSGLLFHHLIGSKVFRRYQSNLYAVHKLYIETTGSGRSELCNWKKWESCTRNQFTTEGNSHSLHHQIIMSTDHNWMWLTRLYCVEVLHATWSFWRWSSQRSFDLVIQKLNLRK